MHREQKRKILLVEDDALIGLQETTLLEDNDFTVIVVYTGEKAVETIKSSTGIDLVLMDFDLGEGMTGTEAALRIQEVRKIPIIFLSSHAKEEIESKLKGITAHSYVSKDAKESLLIETIHSALQLSDDNKWMMTTSQVT